MLRSLIAATAVLLLVVAFPARAEAPHRYANPALGFAIDFPGAPKETVEDSNIAAGPIHSTTVGYEGPQSGFSVDVSEASGPRGIVWPVDKVLTGFLEGHEIIQSSTVTISGVDAREAHYRGRLDDGRVLIGWVRVVFRNKRLYQIASIHLEGVDDAPSRDFVRSFRFID